MTDRRRHHPDLRSDAPGRIPESLIDAAIDGDLDPQLQQQIGDALRYDHARRQEFHDTRDAINALRMPMDTPDLSDRVLERANRHRKFIPRKLRQQVRAGRVGMAALLLVGLLGVAALQRAYPRLTTIASQRTPVQDLEQAVGNDSAQLAHALSTEVSTLRQRVAPVAGLFDRPPQRPRSDRQLRYDLAMSTAPLSTDPNAPHAFATPRGFTTVSFSAPRERLHYGFIASADAHQILLTTPTRDSRSDPEDELPDLP